MKFISWNVNGLRACAGKGFEDSFKALDADFSTWSSKATGHIGTMLTRRAIPGLRYIPGWSLFP